MSLLTEPVGVSHFLVVGAVMFVTGAICMATKRNALERRTQQQAAMRSAA